MLLRSLQRTRSKPEQHEKRAQRKMNLEQRMLHNPQALPDSEPRYHIDYMLLWIVCILTLVGLIAVLSASAHVAQSEIGDGSYYFKNQIKGVFLGAIALYVASRIDLYHLPRWIKPLMAITILLLVATHLPVIGVTSKGSSRWIHLPGLTLQPSEIAKPVLVLYLSAILGHPKLQTLDWKTRLIPLIPVGLIMAIILKQPDLGTTMVIGITILIMYFAAGTPGWKIGSVIASGLVGFILLSWSTPYQRDRITYWLNPWADPGGKGYHLIQSMIAIGSGGLWGNGFGQSVQKLFYLPEQHTDFIFAVISEELGFLGVCLLLLLFILLTQRGVTIACKSPTPYLKLLAIGLASMVSMQAFVNLGVVTGTIPTTGLTLPFISYGSSSLIVNLGAMGLLLNISRYIPPPLRHKRPPREKLSDLKA